jgi:hypothetical protein
MAILARGAERILVVVIGALAIFLGYKLFAIIATADGAAKAEAAGVSIYLTNIGPGVFFALFGAVLIGYSVAHPTSYERVVRQGDSVTQESYRSMMEPRATAGATAAATRAPIPCETLVRALAEMAGEAAAKTPPQPRREMALREARVCLMARSWNDAWGRREQFEDWVYNFAEGEPPPPAIKGAVAVYRGTA